MFRRYCVGVFEDETKLLAAVRALRARRFPIVDVYAPYAVHGIDEALGIARSRLPWVTLIACFSGVALAFYFQFWTSVADWRINVGGKPDNSTLAFLPVAFEITILLGGLATVLAFFVRGKLFPGARPRFVYEGISHDRFAVVLDAQDGALDEAEAKDIFARCGALRVESRVMP